MEDITKILKNVPKGTKLYSPIFGECFLDHIVPNGEIWIKYKYTFQVFDKYGRYYNEGQCLLFPSKKMQDWEEYQHSKLEFHDGDILFSKDYINSYIYIYREPQKGIDICYCYKLTAGYLHICNTTNSYDCTLPSNTIIETETRFATDSEKQKLFDALAKENKAWDAKKKQIVDLCKKHKFKPFDKVLVRDDNTMLWRVNIFSHYVSTNFNPYVCIAGYYRQCIPYEGNEHLVGTNKNP